MVATLITLGLMGTFFAWACSLEYYIKREEKLRELHEGSKSRYKSKIKELVEDYNKLVKESNELEEELKELKAKYIPPKKDAIS